MTKKEHKNVDTQTKVIIITCIISGITLLITLFRTVYNLGCKHTEAKMNQEIGRVERECSTTITTLEHQQREELDSKDAIIKEREKELQEWREKYFVLLDNQKIPANNSP